MISYFDQSIIRRGELPGSNGGIYNPGVLIDQGRIYLLCRREIDYQFSHIVHPELIEIDPDSLKKISSTTLTKFGYPEFSRIEDFRCIHFEGKQLVVHTLHTGGRLNNIASKNYAGLIQDPQALHDPLLLKPVISEIQDGVLRPYDAFDLPIQLKTVEKNWVLFEHHQCLHCIYDLDPLTIFRKESTGEWVLIIEEDNGWSKDFPFYLSNSVNLIPFESGYLGFWHTIEYGSYVHGAYWLDHNLKLQYKTDVLIDSACIKTGPKPGVIYITSASQRENEILLFYGKADSDTAVMRIDAKTLWHELQNADCTFEEDKKIRIQFIGNNLSGIFKAMQSLEKLKKSMPEYSLLLYLDSTNLLKLAKSLAIEGIGVRSGALYKGSYHYLLQGEDGQLIQQI